MKKIGKKNKKAGLGVTLVTVLFALIGTVCLVIGYHDTVLQWLSTVGIVVLVVAAIPALVIGYMFIQKKIDS